MMLTFDFLDDLLKFLWITIFSMALFYVGLLAQYISAEVVGYILGVLFIVLSSWRLLVAMRMPSILVPVNYGISVVLMTLLPSDGTTAIWTMALIPSVGLVILEVGLRKIWRYIRPRKMMMQKTR